MHPCPANRDPAYSDCTTSLSFPWSNELRECRNAYLPKPVPTYSTRFSVATSLDQDYPYNVLPYSHAFRLVVTLLFTCGDPSLPAVLRPFLKTPFLKGASTHLFLLVADGTTAITR